MKFIYKTFYSTIVSLIKIKFAKNFKNFTGNTRNASTVEEIDVFFNYLKKYLQSCLKGEEKEAEKEEAPAESTEE